MLWQCRMITATFVGWVDKPELNERTYCCWEVTFEKRPHPLANSRSQRHAKRTANKLRLPPRNVMLAELEMLTRRTANDLVGKQRN